jgi:phosphoglycerate dehydrogenase-like enzyme
VSERCPLVIVEHPTVSAQMREVMLRLNARGIDSGVVSSDEFNRSWESDQTTCVLVSGAAICNRPTLERFPRLRGVIYIASGTDSVDLDAATEMGIAVGHSPTSQNTESMAEATVLLILAGLYDLNRSQRILKGGEERPDRPYARMLQGKTVGLVGYGKIAESVVARLSGWGTEILVFSRRLDLELPLGVARAELDELIERSDVLSLHAALEPQTRGMLDAKRIAKLRRGALVINTARGAIADEQALFDAAAAGHIALALDTFAREPLPFDSPLRSLPNATLTPHIVGHTEEAIDSIVRAATDNLELVINRQLPKYLRNPAVSEAYFARMV